MPRALTFAVAFMLGGATMLPAQDHTDSASAILDHAPIGEALVYDARFGLIDVGKGLMQVVGIDTLDGQPMLHVMFRLRGGPFFFRLDDRMDSWIRLGDFSSRRFVQDFHEGKNDRHTEYDIFPDSGYYRESGVDSLCPTTAAPLDDAAFFYFVRTLDLTPGKRYALDRYFKPDRNPVVLEALARDTIDVPAGRFPCVVVRPIIKGGGIFKEGADGRMWITDDARRIVAQIQTKFAFGSITLRLTGIQHDSTAR